MRSKSRVLPAWQYVIFLPPLAYLILINFDLVKSQSLTGDIIVVATIGLLSVITFYSIYQNKKFYIHLEEILATLNRNPESSSLAKDILRKIY